VSLALVLGVPGRGLAGRAVGFRGPALLSGGIRHGWLLTFGGGWPLGVVGHVPPCPLELNRRRREQQVQHAAALLAFGQRRVGEFSDSFKLRTTLLAPVFVKRQAFLPTSDLLPV